MFKKKIANSLKSSNLGINPVKTTDFLRNSEKNRRKFDENLQNLPSLSKINKNCAEFCKTGAKVLKNHRNLEWCKGKNVDLVKSFPTSIYLQKSASIQPRTSLSKFEVIYSLLFIRLLRCTPEWPHPSRATPSSASPGSGRIPSWAAPHGGGVA